MPAPGFRHLEARMWFMHSWRDQETTGVTGRNHRSTGETTGVVRTTGTAEDLRLEVSRQAAENKEKIWLSRASRVPAGAEIPTGVEPLETEQSSLVDRREGTTRHE